MSFDAPATSGEKKQQIVVLFHELVHQSHRGDKGEPRLWCVSAQRPSFRWMAKLSETSGQSCRQRVRGALRIRSSGARATDKLKVQFKRDEVLFRTAWRQSPAPHARMMTMRAPSIVSRGARNLRHVPEFPLSDGGVTMKQPNTVLECLPHLRLFARVMCPDPNGANQAVADCLERVRKGLSEGPSPDHIFITLLTDLAAAIRRLERPRASNDAPGTERTMHALRRLPPHHRDVLIVVALFRLRYWEAAAVCNCPVGTIKSRFNRAKVAFAAKSEPNPSINAIRHPDHVVERHI